MHRGEMASTPGQWDHYVEPEDFYRLREQRAERCHRAKRTAGRPPLGYLLAQLATCGECGGRMRVETDTRQSSRAPRYVCTAHRAYAHGAAEWCPALPVNASVADQIVMANLGSLLADADALGEQMRAGRMAEVERMGAVASEAPVIGCSGRSGPPLMLREGSPLRGEPRWLCRPLSTRCQRTQPDGPAEGNMTGS
jgi:Recombinase zinc beta ribbon domain